MSNRVVVIGGGIAGASAAAFLAQGGADVTMVERESTLAYHTTGRSAAQWIENYGHAATRTLTRLSKPFFDDPPAGTTDSPLLQARPFLNVGRSDQADLVQEALSADDDVLVAPTQISPVEAAALCPMVDPSKTAFAIIESGSMDIDVGGLHQAFVRMLRAAGGNIATSTRVDAARPHGDRWKVETTMGDLDADVLVNAAGAWGDVVAQAAGVVPVGLQPRRRTAFMAPSSSLPNADPADSHHWPMLVNIGHEWYVKPDGPQFLCSPADQTPTAPADAKAEELDIALAIERVNNDTAMNVRSVASSWAGLRTFAADESLVLGPDPDHPRFIWCVGQGGVGIQTSPAAGQLIADLTLGTKPDPSLMLDQLRPDRLR